MIEKQMKEIIERLKALTARLEKIVAEDTPSDEKVDDFITDITWTLPNLGLNTLVRRLVREMQRDKSLETRKFD